MLLNQLVSISLRHIYVFLMAARFGNFSKAGQELYMSQTTVSRNIDSLEELLGFKLFNRSSNSVTLTEPGKVLMEEWSYILELLEKSVDKAGHVFEGHRNQLRIGDFNTTRSDMYLMPIIQRFEANNHDVELLIDRVDPSSLIDGIINSRYDAVFFTNFATDWFKRLRINYIEILNFPPSVIISKNNPLFKKEHICFEDFNSQNLVSIRRQHVPYHETILKVCEEIGFMPKEIKFVDNPHSMSLELQRGECIAIMDICYTPIDKEKFRFVELSDCKTKFGFVLGYSKDNSNLKLKRFIEAATAFASMG